MIHSQLDSSNWSLVTVTFNSAKQLRDHWSKADIGDAAWIVVDNASSDDSIAVARELGARVISLDRNFGFAAANNVALAQMERPWTAFVNPDVCIQNPADLSRLAEACVRYGAIVAPQLLNPDGSEQPNGRGVPFLLDKAAHRSLRLPSSKLTSYSRTGLQVPTYVCWAIGAAIGGTTQNFRDLGGWDERYFVYYEDHDLGLRAWAKGIPVVVDPMIRWEHEWQRSTSRLALRPWRHELRAGVSFYRAHPHVLTRYRFAAASRQTPWMGAMQSLLWRSAGPGQHDDGSDILGQG